MLELYWCLQNGWEGLSKCVYKMVRIYCNERSERILLLLSAASPIGVCASLFRTAVYIAAGGKYMLPNGKFVQKCKWSAMGHDRYVFEITQMKMFDNCVIF